MKTVAIRTHRWVPWVLGGCLILFACLTIGLGIHLFTKPLLYEAYLLDTEKRVVDQEGYGYRVILPKELAKRDRQWDRRMVLFENGYCLGHPADTHQEVREVGEGAYKASGKSIWLSTADLVSHPATNQYEYKLLVYEHVDPLYFWSGILIVFLLVVACLTLKLQNTLQNSLTVVTLIWAVVGFVWFASFLHERYHHPAVAGSAPRPWFGTENVPNSDAAHWVNGAYSFYFFNTVTDPETFRPTVSLFYAAILKLRFELSDIPLSVHLFFLSSILIFLFFGARPVSFVLSWLFLFLTVFHKVFLNPMSTETLHMDFLSMAFSMVGILLIGEGLFRGRGNLTRTPLMIGFLLLGVVIAIRGTPIIGMFVIWLAFIWKGPLKGRTVEALLTGIALIVPTAIDTIMRSKFGIQSNLPIALYGITIEQGDANQHWVRIVQDYLAAKPDNIQVMKDFISYRFSEAGIANLKQCLIEATYHELKFFLNPGYRFLLISAAVTAILIRLTTAWDLLGRFSRRYPKKKWSAWLQVSRIPFCVILILAPFGAAYLPPVASKVVWGGLCILFCWFSARNHWWLSFSLMVIYLGSMALVVMLSNLGWDRVQATFRWAATAAFLCSFIEPYRRRITVRNLFPAGKRIMTGYCYALLGGILFLYLGNTVLPVSKPPSEVAKLKEGTHLLPVEYCDKVGLTLYWSLKNFTFAPGPAPTDAIIETPSDIKLWGVSTYSFPQEIHSLAEE